MTMVDENEARLSVELEERDGFPVIRAHGEIDLYTVPEFEHAIQAGIDRGAEGIIVDLSDVSYLDSAALSALLMAYKKLANRNASLCVVAPRYRPGVWRVLEITRLDMFMGVLPTLEDALKALQSKKGV